MVRWGRLAAKVLVVLTIVGSVLVGGDAGAQEPRPIHRIVGERSPDRFMVSGCLEGVARPETGTTIAASTEIRLDGVPLRTVDGAVAWRADQPADGCSSGVWAIVRLEIADFAPRANPDAPIRDWPAVGVGLWVSIEEGPHAGELHRGSAWFQLLDGPPRGHISSVEATPHGLRVRGTVTDPTGAPARFRLTVVQRNVIGPNWHPTTWSQIPVRMATRPWPFPPTGSIGSHDIYGLAGDRWFDELVPFGEVCLFAQDPRSSSDQLADSSVPLGCDYRAHNALNGLRTARISGVKIVTTGSPRRQDVVVSGIVRDPWVAPGEAGPVVLARVVGTGESVWVRARPRPDIEGPLPGGAGAFEFVAPISKVPSGWRRICIYDRATTEPPQWSAWMYPKDMPMDCIDYPVPGWSEVVK